MYPHDTTPGQYPQIPPPPRFKVVMCVYCGDTITMSNDWRIIDDGAVSGRAHRACGYPR